MFIRMPGKPPPPPGGEFIRAADVCKRRGDRLRGSVEERATLDVVARLMPDTMRTWL